MMVLAMEKTGARRTKRLTDQAASGVRTGASRAKQLTDQTAGATRIGVGGRPAASALDREVKRLNVQLADLRRRVAAVSRLEREVQQLTVEVAELRRLSEGGAEAAFDRSEWLRRHGVKPGEVEVVHPRLYSDVAMTVTEAAEELGLSLEQVRRHLRAEHIAGIPRRGPGGWVVSRESLAEFQRAREDRQRPKGQR